MRKKLISITLLISTCLLGQVPNVYLKDSLKHQTGTGTSEFSLVNSSNESPFLDTTDRIDIMVGEPFDFKIPVSDADGDLIGLSVESLPAWLSIQNITDFNLSTFANFERTLSSPTTSLVNSLVEITADKEGNFYFIDVGFLNKSSGGNNFEVLTNLFDTNLYGQFNFEFIFEIESVDDALFFHDGLRIFKYKDNKVDFVAGSEGVFGQVPIDGLGENAVFAGILDIYDDHQGGLYVIDRRKVRHVSNNGLVTTVAGSGELGIEDGDALSSSFINIFELVIEEDRILIYEGVDSRIRELKDGQITTILNKSPKGGYPNFYNDALGFIYLFSDRGVWILDSDGDTVEEFEVNNGPVDGARGSMGWSAMGSIKRSLPGVFYFADKVNADIRKFSYSYNYSLFGTPTDSELGEHKIMLKITDGKSDPVEKEFTINVVSVTGIDSNLEELDITLSPVPSDGVLNISLQDALYPSAKIIISDLNGREYQSLEVNNSQRNFELDVAQLREGLYFINIKNQGKIYRKKFLIQR